MDINQFEALVKYLALAKPKGTWKEDSDFAKKLLVIAKADLATSKARYTAGDFPNAVYHLQQGSEKIAKAYGVITGIITQQELKRIGHTSPRIFIETLKQNYVKGMLYELAKNDPALRDADSKLDEILKKDTSELAKMSADQINGVLDDYENALADFQKGDLLTQGVNGFYKELLEAIMGFAVGYSLAFALAFLTYCHESSYTRYPGGKIEPSDYTSEMGIVQTMKRMIKTAEKSAIALEVHIEKLEQWDPDPEFKKKFRNLTIMRSVKDSFIKNK